MLVKGCEEFLACMVLNKRLEICLKDIPVVLEFPEIFLDYLTTLPPERG